MALAGDDRVPFSRTGLRWGFFEDNLVEKLARSVINALNEVSVDIQKAFNCGDTRLTVDGSKALAAAIATVKSASWLVIDDDEKTREALRALAVDAVLSRVAGAVSELAEGAKGYEVGILRTSPLWRRAFADVEGKERTIPLYITFTMIGYKPAVYRMQVESGWSSVPGSRWPVVGRCWAKTCFEEVSSAQDAPSPLAETAAVPAETAAVSSAGEKEKESQVPEEGVQKTAA